MCSLACIDQNRLLLPFEPSTESSSSLYLPDCDLEKEDFLDSPFFLPLRAKMTPAPFSEEEEEGGYACLAPAALVQKNGIQDPPSPSERGAELSQNKVVSEMSLELYKDYLKKRISETFSKPVPTRQLFNEITAKGYRGTAEAMKIFLSMIRKSKDKPPEAYLSFHKDYLKKRVIESLPNHVPVKQLVQEIKVRGYQGSFSGVNSFISIIRGKKNRPPEASFQFHKEYIKKRLEKGAPKSVSIRQLFEEIKANGYLGAYSTVATFVSILQNKKQPKASFQFHKEYIKKRLEKGAPESVSTRQLFEEIKANGYLGMYSTVRAFVAMLREKKVKKPEESLEFHKNYISKRIEEDTSTKQVLKEITAKGYQGTIRTVQAFISMIRTTRSPEASMQFHKNYITKRLEKAGFEYVSIKQLFTEIQASGYLGSYNTVRGFVSSIRKKQNKKPEESFQFHKNYITKRVEETAFESVPIKQFFEEIKANGYLGAYNTVKAFVSTIRNKKNKRPETSLHFHKEYIKKRVEEDAPTKQLLEEVKARGYQGTLKTMQIFLSTIRTSSLPKASLQFHKEYIKKRLEKGAESVSTKQIFEEIRANGYLGIYSTVAAFVSTIRVNRVPEASLQFHKEYIKKRLEKGAEYVSTKTLFEEIKANGYLGAYNTVKSFVSTIRRC